MAKKKTEGFETLVEQVEEALAELESGELPLETALKRYEEGVKSLRKCYEFLKKAEKRVQLLSERDGEIVSEPMEVDDKAADGGSGAKLF